MISVTLLLGNAFCVWLNISIIFDGSGDEFNALIACVNSFVSGLLFADLTSEVRS